MEVRRRPVESVGGAAAPRPATRDADIGVEDVLVEEGLRLYAEAENSGFHDVAILVSSLRCFLRAAMQGREEARDWIDTFLSATSALPPSVPPSLPPGLLRLLRWVREATPEEGEVYSVAEDMFRGMSRGGGGGGGGAIPQAEFDGAVQSLLAGRCEHSPQLVKSARGLRLSVKRMLSSALESNNSTEVTQDMFCESAVAYARGILPHDDRAALTHEQEHDFKEANILRKVTQYPVLTAHYYKSTLLKLIERRGIKWIWSSVPTKQFYLLTLAYFLPMMSARFIITSIATGLFLAAFITTCVGTLQIMLAAEKVFSFTEYSSIFQYFSERDRKIDTRRSELILVRRSLIPFLTFGASFCITLLTFHLSHHDIVPNEIPCIISGFVSLCVFLQFECYKSPLFLACSSSRLLAWLYVFLIAIGDVVPVPEFLFYFGSASVSLPLLPGFAPRVNLLTLVQFPVQCLLVACCLAQNRWRNIYSGLGPYLLFTSWWVLTRHFFVLSSPVNLFLGTFGLIAVLSISPFLPIIFLASPLCVLFYYGFSGVFFVYASIVLCFVVLLLVLGKFRKRLMEARWLDIPFDYLVLVQFLVSIPVVLLGASLVTRYYTPSHVPTVSLAQYSEYCGPQTWVGGGGGNMVQTQLDCLHLKDRVLVAGGVVREVKIHEVSNDRELSLFSLPGIVRGALTCLLGRLEPVCEHRSDMEKCRRELFTGCHFHHSNRYTFAIDLNVSLSPPPKAGEAKSPQRGVSFVLLAPNAFTKFAKSLKTGDNLHFNATFESGMGSDEVILRLVALEGVSSVGRDEETSEDDSWQLFAHQVGKSFTHTLNVVFDVLLGYTAPH